MSEHHLTKTRYTSFNLLDEINQGGAVASHDGSTNGLINYYLQLKPKKF